MLCVCVWGVGVGGGGSIRDDHGDDDATCRSCCWTEQPTTPRMRATASTSTHRSNAAAVSSAVFPCPKPSFRTTDASTLPLSAIVGVAKDGWGHHPGFSVKYENRRTFLFSLSRFPFLIMTTALSKLGLAHCLQIYNDGFI